MNLDRLQHLIKGERGEAPLLLVLLVPVLFLVLGLVVDGGGKVRADEQATLIAQSAARAGANAGVGQGAGERLVIDRSRAVAAARSYLSQAGATGSVRVRDGVVEVDVIVPYEAKILRVGVDWAGKGEGEAVPRGNAN